MAALDATPDVVDVAGYAGDTLTISVTVPTDYIAGRVFTAQVRSTADAGVVDADFVITAPTVVDGAAFLVLPASETARLVQGAPLGRATLGGRTVTGNVYEGAWDVQLAPVGGGDPVKTLARGKLTVAGDVTR